MTGPCRVERAVEYPPNPAWGIHSSGIMIIPDVLGRKDSYSLKPTEIFDTAEVVI